MTAETVLDEAYRLLRRSLSSDDEEEVLEAHIRHLRELQRKEFVEMELAFKRRVRQSAEEVELAFERADELIAELFGT